MGVVADTVSNVVNDVVQSAGDAGSSVADTGSQVVSDVGNTVSTAVSDTVQAIGDAGANIDDVVNEQIPGGWATVGAVAATIATAGAASGTLAAEAGADAGAEAGAAEAGAEGAAVADAGASSVADAGLSMVPPDAIPPEPLGPELDPTGSLANPNTINPLDALKAAGTGAAKGALTNVAVDAITGRPITPSGLAIAGLTGGVGGAAGNVAGQLGAGTIGSGIAAGTAGGTIGAALNNGNVGQGAVSGALSGLSSGITGNMLSGLDPVTTATGQSVASTLANAAKTGNTNNLAENLVGGALASAGLTSGTNALLNSGSPLPDYTNDVPYSPNGASQPLPVNTTPSNDVSTNTQTSDTTSPLSQVASTTVESPVNQTIAPLTQLASEQPTQKVDLTTPSPLLSAVTQPITLGATYAPLASANTTGTVSDVGGSNSPLVTIGGGNTAANSTGTSIDPETGKSVPYFNFDSGSGGIIPGDATPVEGNPNEYQGADGTTYTIDPTTGNVSSTPPPTGPLEFPSATPSTPYQPKPLPSDFQPYVVNGIPEATYAIGVKTNSDGTQSYFYGDGTVSSNPSIPWNMPGQLGGGLPSDTGGTNPVGSNPSDNLPSGTSNQPSVDLTPINNQISGLNTSLDTTNKTIADNQAQTNATLNNLSDAQKAQVASQVAMGVSLTAAINSVQSNVNSQVGALGNNVSNLTGNVNNLQSTINDMSKTSPKATLLKGSRIDSPLPSSYDTPTYTYANPAPNLNQLAEIQNAADGGIIHMETGGDLPMTPQQLRGRPTQHSNLMGWRGTQLFANGGQSMEDRTLPEGHNPQFFSEGGLNSIEHRYVTGDGDGTSDSIPAMLANGEFVIPADVVSSLGNGSNDSGAKVLDELLSVIREHKQKHDAKNLPPDSKGALAYLLQAKQKARA